MKRLILTFTILLTFFLGVNNVKADTDYTYSCYYESDTVDFVVIGGFIGAGQPNDVKAIAQSSSFEINGSQLTSSSVWKGKQLIVYGEDRLLTSNDKCYNYMYFNQVTENIWTGFWSGNTKSDKIYFSDEYLNIDWFDLVLRKAEYSESSKNAILDELFCTYNPSSEDLTEFGLVDISSLSYKIQKGAESGVGSYEVFGNFSSLYKRDYAEHTEEINYRILNTNYSVKDHFHIRVFWDEETSTWSCPPTVLIGVKNKAIGTLESRDREIHYSEKPLADYNEAKKFFETEKDIVMYQLNSDASYIKYEQAPPEQSQICTFNKVGSSEWSMSLVENTYLNGDKEYTIFNKNKKPLNNKVEIDIPTGLIQTSCDFLPEIYTNCLSSENCKVSREYFNGSEKLVSNAKANSEDKDNAIQGTNIITGEKYKQLLCSLSGKLEKAAQPSLINKLPNLKIADSNGKKIGEYKINGLNCDLWKYDDNFECDDSNCGNVIYSLENQVFEIKKYCNGIYSTYGNGVQVQWARGRMDECVSYEKFYDSLVNLGIITDFSEGCDFLSDNFTKKLIWVLDLLKIVGPLAALGLGTLDFIKAIVSGDADKEMKTAFKRLSTRLIATALLFVIPVILAFLMDTFLNNQEGYNSQNPFCSVVDWDE